MNPSGLWKGKCQGRIGNFKFINVQLLPEKSSKSAGQHSHSGTCNSMQSGSSSSSNNRRRSSSSGRLGGSSGSSSHIARGRIRSNLLQQQQLDQQGLEGGGTRSPEPAVSRTMIGGDLQGGPGSRGGFSSTCGSRANDKPKSVDELLRRIGLEVTPY